MRGSTWSSNINGALPFSKQTLLDGADISVNRSGTNSETSVSLEAIQEFSVITTGYSAEYGRMQGGVYSYVMRSGGNQLHGSGYGSIRNEVLNANTFVNNWYSRKRGAERKWDLGGGIGGPVYIPKVYNGKDKTFFYVTLEKYHDKTFTISGPNQSVPLPEFYDGDLSRLLQTVSAGTDALGRNVLRGAIYDPATLSGRWRTAAGLGTCSRTMSFRLHRISQVCQEHKCHRQSAHPAHIQGRDRADSSHQQLHLTRRAIFSPRTTSR